MQKYSDLKIGISFTASWAWGISLGIGHTMLRTRGLIPFSVWAICNIFSLLFFGWFVKRNPVFINITKNSLVKVFLMITQIYAIWINTRIMAQYLSTGTIYGDLLAGMVTLVVMLATFKGKLHFSILSDQWQYAVMVIGLTVVAILGYKNGDIRFIKMAANSDLGWGLWMGAGILMAPFHNAMYFQREEQTTSFRPYWIHTAAFGLYMLLVGITGIFDYKWSNILTSIIIIAITTSSQDSAVAAMQYLIGDKWTVIICLVLLLSWPLSRTAQAINVWELYQTARIFIILPLIIYYWRWGRSIKKLRKHIY